MKIEEITETKIIFSNGNEIRYDHEQDCCEHNYADFDIIEHDIYIDYDFSENLEFVFVDHLGFVFGSDGHKIFVPCYSEQNGYYTTEIDIYYNDKLVLHGLCKENIFEY